MIRFKHKGDFSKAKRYMEKLKAVDVRKILDAYGCKGVAALAAATPVESGLTANSWSYEITTRQGSSAINFYNSNVRQGVNIAIIIQYGHGTGTGGWVQGRDYINPAIQPLFDDIANQAWREVTKL